MSQMLKMLAKAAKSGPTKPSLLSRLAAIATMFGGAWLVFVTQYPAAVKGPIGSAVAIFVAIWINAEHATARHTDAMAVAAMQPGAVAPPVMPSMEELMAQAFGAAGMKMPGAPAPANGSAPTGAISGASSEGAS